jgi:uncharacterized protein YoxC
VTIVLLQARALRDTVVVVQQQPGWMHWVQAFAGIAQIVLALALLILGVALLIAALKVKALIRKVEEQGQKLRIDLAPAIHNVTAVSENVNALSKTVRADAEKLSATVNAATETLTGAAKEAERKVGEFNALIGVVQEEAEDLFIGGAAALRGLRAGTETFRRFQGGELEYVGDAYVEQDEDVDDEDFEDDEVVDVELRRGAPPARGE